MSLSDRESEADRREASMRTGSGAGRDLRSASMRTGNGVTREQRDP
mgnify:CR=1 FL=1